MRLTEFTIERKAKTSDMEAVTVLNCCCLGLTDVSIVERLVNVKTLSLSLNHIESLNGLQGCVSVETLYLRKNKISDIKQLRCLEKLPVLKSLVVCENPFCEPLGAKYRSAVLSYLPKLEILDEKQVESSDREQEALRQVEPEQQIASPDLKSCSPQLPQPSVKTAAICGDGSCQLSECPPSESFARPQRTSSDHNSAPDLCGVENPRQPPAVTQRIPRQSGAGRETILTAPTSLDLGGVDAQMADGTTNSGIHSELLTAVLCLAERLDQSGLKVLKDMIDVYVHDDESSGLNSQDS